MYAPLHSSADYHQGCFELAPQKSVHCWFCLDKKVNLTAPYGAFCGFSCAKAWILDHRKPGYRQDLVSLHHFAFQHGTGRIPVSPPKFLLKQFGGPLTHDQFHGLLGTTHRLVNAQGMLQLKAREGSKRDAFVIFDNKKPPADTGSKVEFDLVRKATSWDPQWDGRVEDQPAASPPKKPTRRSKRKQPDKKKTKKKKTKSEGIVSLSLRDFMNG